MNTFLQYYQITKLTLFNLNYLWSIIFDLCSNWRPLFYESRENKQELLVRSLWKGLTHLQKVSYTLNRPHSPPTGLTHPKQVSLTLNMYHSPPTGLVRPQKVLLIPNRYHSPSTGRFVSFAPSECPLLAPRTAWSFSAETSSRRCYQIDITTNIYLLPPSTLKDIYWVPF